MQIARLGRIQPGDRLRQRRALRFGRIGPRFSLEREDDPGGVGGL